MEENHRIINHCRIIQVVTKCTIHFQRIFKQRWLQYQRLKIGAIIEWKDSEENRSQLMELCRSATLKMKESMKNKCIALWDISLLSRGIRAVSDEILHLGGSTQKQEDDAINGIRETRNKLSHEKFELSDAEFDQYFKQLSTFMIKLGETRLTIDELKKDLMKIGDSKAEKAEYERLKYDAKKLFDAKKYEESIEAYNRILNLSGLSREERSVIYSDLSATFFSMRTKDSYLMAIREAEVAIHLCPRWWKGHFRLGKAEAALGNYHEAEDALKYALTLNPDSRETRDELSAVSAKLDALDREASPNLVIGDMLNGLFGDMYNGYNMHGMSSGGGRRQIQDPTVQHDLLVKLEDIYNGCVKKMRITRKVVQHDGTAKTEDKVLSVKIEPGCESDTKIIYPKEGDQLPGCVPADIVFVIKDKPHPLFKREGVDIRYVHKLSLKQALCGTTINIPTLDGTNLQLESNTVIKPNSTKTLRGQGLPNPKLGNKRGDLIVEFDIQFPDSL